MKPYPMRTDRLLLRRPRLADWQAAVPLLNDRDIARFVPLIPQPYRRRNWTAWIRKNAGAPARRPEGLSYPAVVLLDGVMVGMLGMRWDAKDRAANIGYWVGRPFRGQGIATEAARAVTSYCFRTLGAQKVWATVMAGNPASPEVLANCGMRLDGVLRSHGAYRGRRYDLACYSVLKEEWRRRRW